jgi:hypothetical protein
VAAAVLAVSLKVGLGDVRLADGWAWIVVVLGAAFIALGGLLLSVLG